MKRFLNGLVDGIRRLAGVKTKPEFPPELVQHREPVVSTVKPRARPTWPIRRQLYRSAFTKRGPGVVAGIRRALVEADRDERLHARRMGWDRGMVTATGEVR